MFSFFYLCGFNSGLMISRVKGKVLELSPTHTVIMTQGGVGYHIHITLPTYSAIGENTETELLTYWHKTDQYDALYGFSSDAERYMFSLLISVSGVGAATARLLLSSLTIEDLQQAITLDQAQVIKRVKGIGDKTAKRVILDLKDKIVKIAGTERSITPASDNTHFDQALSALITLGFQKNAVTKALNSIPRTEENSSVENLIKHALRILS